jgi:hypothetical protein
LDRDLPILRTSERKDWGQCHLKWYWAWRMGLKERFRPADQLWFGTGIHLALAGWYIPGVVRGVHPAETWEQFCADEESQVRAAVGDRWEDDVWVDAKTLGTSILEKYVDFYGEDESWDVIEPEHPFQVYVPKRNNSANLAIYAGTFDGVYRDLDTGEIWLMEHKSAKQISTAHLPIDSQAGAYWAIASTICQEMGLLKKGEAIKGIMYNFLKKAAPDDRPENDKGQKLNKDGTVSKKQPSPAFIREAVTRTRDERRTQIGMIQNEVAWMNLARRHPDRITKNPSYDCHRRCQFFDMCTLHEKGGDKWRDYAKVMFRVEDPYKDHRKSASE